MRVKAFLQRPRGRAYPRAAAWVVPLLLAACASSPHPQLAATSAAVATAPTPATVRVVRSEPFAERRAHFESEREAQWLVHRSQPTPEVAYWSARDEAERSRRESASALERQQRQHATTSVSAPVATARATPLPGAAPSSMVVNFEFDRAVVSALDRARLATFVAPLSNATVALRVVGHTDAIGTDLYNDLLSARRAEAVRNELLQLAFPADRIAVVGKGSAEPAAENATELGRARNRRAVLITTVTAPPVATTSPLSGDAHAR